MRADRSKLSPDKQSGVDSFLAPYLPLSADDAKRLGQDKTFLNERPQHRRAELRRLAWARLQKIAHPPVQFDADADDSTRATQLSKLRDTVIDTTLSDHAGKPLTGYNRRYRERTHSKVLANAGVASRRAVEEMCSRAASR
jgi:hypothetical protein